MGEQSWIGLADAVAAVRGELQQAVAEGAGQAIRFTTGPVELEFTVAVNLDARAKVRVMVLPWSADVQASYARGATHRLKVTLQPVDSQGADVEIAAASRERPR
ncbi:trypco2 family protein [Streptomyces niger]|uniref:trypco2 family protein n=1 Tax=Streptomyces niger TaxID=66373 RepID=UPI00069973C0|nr:trypco2 family protein [Streptomyces niger]